MREALPRPPDERTGLAASSQESYATCQKSSKAHHNLAGLSALRFRLICLSLWSCTFLASFDSTLIATLLSEIGSAFNASNQASWLGTSYLLSTCCSIAIFGKCSDLFGRRAAQLTSLAFFIMGIALCGIAPNMGVLIGGRAIAGIGGGGIQSVSVIIMTDLVDLRRRGLFQGYANILFGLGGALGGPMGGWMSDSFGWRMAFLFQLPLLLISGVLIYTQVQLPRGNIPPRPRRARSGNSSPGSTETPDHDWRSNLSRIDYLGSLTLLLAVSPLLISISVKTSSTKSSGEDYRWKDPLIWGLLVGSGIFTIFFILIEGFYAPEPILPLRLLTRRTPFAVAFSSLLMVINQFSILYNIPLYFSAVRLRSSSVAGAHVLPYSAMIGVGSLLIGYVMRRTGKYWWATVISASIIVVSSGLLLTWSSRSPEWITWVAQIPSGFGYAGVLTSSLVALMTNVTREGKGETAVATSLTYMFRSIGQVLGVSLSAAIVQAVVSADLQKLITGPGAADTIYLIRHSTSAIRTLNPENREAAINAYEHALHTVFIFDVVLSVINVFVLMIVKEEEMPDQAKLQSGEECSE